MTSPINGPERPERLVDALHDRDDCVSADEVHRKDMRDPRYRLAYMLGWPRNQADILWLRLRAWWHYRSWHRRWHQ